MTAPPRCRSAPGASHLPGGDIEAVEEVGRGDRDWLAERFETNRTHLRAVAYRMLGSLSEADDAVQEGWLRSDTSGVDEALLADSVGGCSLGGGLRGVCQQ